MNRKDLRVAFLTPSNEQDSENQTYGGRANNPNICASNSVPNVCAFELINKIYRKSARAFKRKYNKLKLGGVNA